MEKLSSEAAFLTFKTNLIDLLLFYFSSFWMRPRHTGASKWNESKCKLTPFIAFHLYKSKLFRFIKGASFLTYYIHHSHDISRW